MIDVTQHLNLVWDVITGYKYTPPQGMDEDDLFQIGCIGLIKAANKYTPALGVEFSTHAVNWIRSEFYTMYQKLKQHKRTGTTIDIQTRVRQTSAILAEILPGDTSAESYVMANELTRVCMEREPVITRLRLEGYTQKEIAKQLGVTHQRISKRIQRMKEIVV